MKKYLVVREQSGGCDYTIRCGLDYDLYDAPDEDALFSIVKQDLLRNYGDTESAYAAIADSGIEYLTAFEISKEVGFNFHKLMNELWAETDKAKKEREETAADEAEFERLKKKLKK